MSSTFTINPDHPSLPGHFPGSPIVPGVVVLAHLVEALREIHPGLTCGGVRRMKFLRPLQAGECVIATFGEPGPDAITVRATVDGALLVDGRLALLGPTG